MILDRQNYLKLCKFCDQTLSLIKNNHYNPFIYISWLHIINEHPNFLKKYKYLFFNNKIQSNFTLIVRFFYYIVSWLSHLFFAIKIKNIGLVFTEIESKSYDVVVISHLNNINSLSIKKDFYFGNISNKLNVNKLNVLNEYLNKTN